MADVADGSICFVTPAHGRQELTRLCLLEHRWAIEQLRGQGVDATQVVIACDENLDVAAELGVATLERSNEPYARRWNHGHEYAHAAGARWSACLDSDSWIHPARVRAMIETADDRTLVTSRAYTVVRHDGRQRLELVNVRTVMSPLYPVSLLARCDYRPVPDGIDRNTNFNSWQTLAQHGARLSRIGVVHPHELVGFDCGRNITGYQRWLDFHGGHVFVGDVVDALADVYPAELVTAARAFYAGTRRNVAV